MEAAQQAEYAELQIHLAVHIQALHEDAESQAELAFRAGELAAELKAASKRGKLNVEAVEAATDREVRNDPSSFGLEKITETAVRSAVSADLRVVEAREASIEADKGADLASALSNAFEHRRSMLKIEVDLWVNNYWGDVEAKGGSRKPDPAVKNMDKHVEEVNARPPDRRQRMRRKLEED